MCLFHSSQNDDLNNSSQPVTVNNLPSYGFTVDQIERLMKAERLSEAKSSEKSLQFLCPSGLSLLIPVEYKVSWG
jgi:hypothetical protein